MKKISLIFLCFFMCCIYSFSQQSKSIINELNTYKPTYGSIVIYQDDAVTKMLGNKVVVSNGTSTWKNQLSTTKSEEGKETSKSTKTVRARGYRIQVYSGNDQKRSKDEAYSRRSQIKSTYPNMDVNITYASPVWRVRAGSFKTRNEAEQALKEMRSSFSSFGKEMHIR